MVVPKAFLPPKFVSSINLLWISGGSLPLPFISSRANQCLKVCQAELRFCWTWILFQQLNTMHFTVFFFCLFDLRHGNVVVSYRFAGSRSFWLLSFYLPAWVGSRSLTLFDLFGVINKIFRKDHFLIIKFIKRLPESGWLFIFIAGETATPIEQRFQNQSYEIVSSSLITWKKSLSLLLYGLLRVNFQSQRLNMRVKGMFR